MELENKLNEFLADLNIFYRKLQNYHWNIEGKDFFQVHAKLEELYDEINEQIDEIAEHIAILGGQPLGTMKDYLEKSSIKEAENKKIKSEEIYNNRLRINKIQPTSNKICNITWIMSHKTHESFKRILESSGKIYARI